MNTPNPDENTVGRREAQRALAESRLANRRVGSLLAQTSATFDLVRAHRETNHFADKFRAIIQGSRP